MSIRKTFEIPFPPSVNHYWRHVSIGKRKTTLISKAGRDYRAAVSQLPGLIRVDDEKRLAVTLLAYMPDNRKRDLDNVPKAILDSLTHAGVWKDDSVIDDLRIVRCGTQKPGHVVVTIVEL